ncbi:MAG: hypothetical protein ACXVHQ_35640 [Solirubrobacteraceae bacterium]
MTTGSKRSETRDWLTVALLLVGGLVVPVFGWALGLLLLWSSSVWTQRDKLIGTMIPIEVICVIAVLIISTTSGAASSGHPMHVTFTLGDVVAWVCDGALIVIPLASARRLVRRAVRSTS